MIMKLKQWLRSNKYTKDFYKMLFKMKNYSKIKKFNKNNIVVTKKIYDTFEKNNINYFYDCGNLLGIVRNGRFLNYDNDIDLGVILREGQTLEQIIGLMKENGFEHVSNYLLNGKVNESNFLYEGVTVDIFLYEFNQQTNNFEVHFYLIDPEIKLDDKDKRTTVKKEIDRFDDFKYIDVNNVKLRIPTEFEKILSVRYGENWLIPDKDFDWKTAPHKIINDVAIKQIVN